MKKNNGEVVIGLLVGLCIGAAMLYISSGAKAQKKANATGMTVSQWEVIREDAGKSTITVVAPAVAGAGVGWLLDNLSEDNGKGSSRNNSVDINGNEGEVYVTISGDSQSSTETRTDTRTDNSNNNNE